MSIDDLKLVCLDVDGTFTNGTYITSEKGHRSKIFYTRDFYGVELLLRKNIIVLIMSQSSDKVINCQINRLRKIWPKKLTRNLKLKTCVKDKYKKLGKFLRKRQIDWKNVAYIGDAENDWESMLASGFVACPSDAINEITELVARKIREREAGRISHKKGGSGAVIDIVKYLIGKKDSTK